jgi:hypothetical protein
MHSGSLSWFHQELQELRTSSAVSLSIHVTDEPIQQNSTVGSTDNFIISASPESSSSSNTPISRQPVISVDIDKEEITTTSCPTEKESTPDFDIDIKSGRPNLKSLIETFIDSESSSTNRVIVGSCGPQSLMDTVRAAASDYAGKGQGPSVTFYNEVHCGIFTQFIWMMLTLST